MPTQYPRLHIPFETGWRFHLGEVAAHQPRLSQKAAGLAGLTNLLEDEKPPRPPSPWDEMMKKLSSLPAFQSFVDPTANVADDWVDVRLPHDWKVDLPYTNDVRAHGPSLVTQGYKPAGVAYYRKLCDIPAEWDGKRVSIDFDGIMGASTVWVNGVCLGEHWSGYTSFAYDLSDILNYGPEGHNVILIRVDCTDSQGWWYEGAGLYRHVWLTITERTYVARWGVFVTTPAITPAQAQVRVQTTLQNDDPAPAQLELLTRLLDPSGQEVARASQAVSLPGLESTVLTQELAIPAPALWSLDSPQLYTAESQVLRAGQVADATHTPFGVREIRYTREGLFINGQHTVIKGACVHQDFAGVGIALPDRVIEYRLEKLKACGCNAYRSAHHPATPALLDLCDRLGILMLDENRLLESTEFGLAELASMILRDRNHPCVYMWSLSNEEPVAGSPLGKRLYRAMVAHARKLDPTRLLTTATSNGKEAAEYLDIADVAGFNYVPDTRQYGLARKQYNEFPKRLFMSTEDACYFTTRGIYEDDPARAWCSSFGSRATLLGDPRPVEGVDLSQMLDIGALAAPERTWQHYLENPFMGGVFIWTGFDYRGEPFPWAWPQMMHQGGIYDLCGFEKDYTYFYKAIWLPDPIVHIMPHWDWPEKVGQTIPVRVYTNCAEVELWINGVSQGRKIPDEVAQVNWQVTYTPGVIEARGYAGDEVIASDKRETTGAPAALRLIPDRAAIHADGVDCALVTVEVVDAAGRLCPTACPTLTFQLSGAGRLLGLGAGDPASHEPEHGPTLRAFNGLCLAILQAADQPGDLLLEVSSPGLPSARIVINLFPYPPAPFPKFGEGGVQRSNSSV